MAHVAKYTRSAIGRLMGHYNREKDDGVNRNNESIDPERTDENYFLKSGSVDSLNERLSQVKVCKRADVNVLCDWVVTLPKDTLFARMYSDYQAYSAFARLSDPISNPFSISKNRRKVLLLFLNNIGL